MKKLIPLVLMLVGIGVGVGAGLVLRPDTGSAELPSVAAADDAKPNARDAAEDGAAPARRDDPAQTDADGGKPGTFDYVKMNNQFVVPIVERDRVEAMIVMSLSLEVTSGQSEAVYLQEPKLRDAFLQVMFDHANMGGFGGVFTDTAKLDTLKSGLTDVAFGILGEGFKSVLITDFVRTQM
ncbi:MAG: flagellar basal body-associated FliL family protein [Roseovarius sp.]